MQSKRLLSMIGMSRKAGKLYWGFDSVVAAVNKFQIKLLLICSDISEKTRDQILHLAEKKSVEAIVISTTMEEIEKLIGKQAGILGIADHNFAVGIKDIITEEEEEGAIYI